MADDASLPRHAAYAVMGLEVDPIEARPFVASFAQRWGGLDHDALMDAIRDGVDTDRLFAIRALGYLRAPEAVATLQPFLQSDVQIERLEAAMQLAELGDRHAVPALSAALMERLPNHLADGWSELDDYRISVPAMLAALGAPDGISALAGAL